MKKFVIEEKFVGYANIIIEAETDDEALSLYQKSKTSDISKFSMNTSVTPISIREAVSYTHLTLPTICSV